MDYHFEIKDVPRMPVLFVKATCAPSEIGPTLGRILPKVFSCLVDFGVRPAGPPFCRYVECRENEFDLEGGIIVDGLVAGVGEVLGAEIGGGQAVYSMHTGPYTELRAHYAAMTDWMKANGHESNVPPFDLYITDPGKVPDSSQWQTEMYWPI